MKIILTLIVFFFSQIGLANNLPYELKGKQVIALNKFTKALDEISRFGDGALLIFLDLMSECNSKDSILKRASKGDQIARYWLVSMHFEGMCVEQDVEKGLNLLHELGNEGYAFAQRDLGYLYSIGKYNNGKFTIKNIVTKDKKKAFYWFEKGAMQNDGPSATYYGDYFLLGEIVPQDFIKAEKYLKIGKRGKNLLGVKQAYLKLTRLYLTYSQFASNQSDFQKVLFYSDKALKEAKDCGNIGFAECMLMASILLEAENPVESYMWANLATAFNEDSATKKLVQEKALERRNKLSKKMTLDQILLAQKLTNEWLPSISH